MSKLVSKRSVSELRGLREWANSIGCLSFEFVFDGEVSAVFYIKGGLPRLLELAGDNDLVYRKTSITFVGGGWVWEVSFVDEDVQFLVQASMNEIQEAGLTIPSTISAPVPA